VSYECRGPARAEIRIGRHRTGRPKLGRAGRGPRIRRTRLGIPCHQDPLPVDGFLMLAIFAYSGEICIRAAGPDNGPSEGLRPRAHISQLEGPVRQSRLGLG
jgi:hypothetical protein